MKSKKKRTIIDKLVWGIKVMLTKRLALDIPGDSKYEFEKDIIKILKKYKGYNKNYSALQRVEIIVDVDEIPKVNTSYLIIDRQKSKEKK